AAQLTTKRADHPAHDARVAAAPRAARNRLALEQLVASDLVAKAGQELVGAQDLPHSQSHFCSSSPRVDGLNDAVARLLWQGADEGFPAGAPGPGAACGNPAHGPGQTSRAGGGFDARPTFGATEFGRWRACPTRVAARRRRHASSDE